MKVIFKHKYLFSFSIIYLVIVIIFYLSNSNLVLAHDLPFHSSRIVCLANNIKLGNLFSGMYYLNGWAYGEAFFYPDIFLLPFSLLYLFSNNIILTDKIMLITINFITLFVIYFLLYNKSKNEKVAFVCSLLYLFSSYRLYDQHIRFCIGEMLSFIFIPLVVYGLDEIMNRDYKNIQFLIMGMCGIILSHILSFFLIIPFCILYVIIHIRQLNKSKIKALFLATIITILITAFFTFPLIEHLLNLNIRGVYAGHYDAGISEHAFSLKQAFSEFTIFKNPKLPPGISIPLILGLLLFFISYKKQKKENKQLTFIAIIFLLLTTHLFPWHLLNKSFFSVIQFPYRFLTISITLLVFSIANTLIIFKNYLNTLYKVFIIVILLSSLVVYSFLNHYNHTYKDFYYNISWGEYLSVHFDLRILIEYPTHRVLKNKYNIESYTPIKTKVDINKQKMIVSFSNNQHNNYLLLPIIYYKGYQVLVNGRAVTVYQKYGKVFIPVNDKKGKIVIQYKGTFIQKMSKLLSLFSIILLCCFYFYKKFKKIKS